MSNRAFCSFPIHGPCTVNISSYVNVGELPSYALPPARPAILSIQNYFRYVVIVSIETSAVTAVELVDGGKS